MLGALRGKVIKLHTTFFVLEVQGVGYIVRTSAQILSELKLEAEIFVYIYDHVREDAHEIFGFFLWSDRELFERLLSVSGVGPKVALAILSAGTGEAIRSAIAQGDLGFLTAIAGVGRKTAQKIILDLKGLLVEAEDLFSGDAEVVEALMTLGYSAQAARAAVRALPHEITAVPERVREALKNLAR